MDLAPNAWQSEVDAYIVIDTGNPGAGERSIPNEVDIATDMKWEAVIAVYGQNFGNIFVDRNSALNTTTQTQNPVTDGGVEARSFGGRNEAAWSSRYDAVEIAVERQQLKDAGWLGDPNTLNFQVFTTKPNTQNGGLLGAGSGDLGDVTTFGTPSTTTSSLRIGGATRTTSSSMASSAVTLAAAGPMTATKTPRS